MEPWQERLADFMNYVGRHPWTWSPLAFILGGIVGSFANVCLLRWPRGLSVNHPPSHCFGCQKVIAWYDNLPMLSYLLLRGRCRHCGTRFSSKYFWIEAFFAASFTLLFVLVVVLNVNRVGLLPAAQFRHGIARELLVVYAYHAFFLGTVLIANLLAFEGTRAPWSLFAPALVVGVAGGTLFPWPWPCDLPQGALAFLRAQPLGAVVGLQPVPVWSPLPSSIEPYGYLQGVLGGMLGIAVGFLLAMPWRLATRLTPSLGGVDAPDVLMAATCGVFLGWQCVLLAGIPALACWLLTAAPRRWLARRGRHVPLGWWIGWGSLMVLPSSHWLLFWLLASRP